MPVGASLRAAVTALVAASSSYASQAPSPSPSPSPTPVETLTTDDIRARERMALISVSTVMQAEKAYAARNGQFFDEVRCLTAPATCIPGYPADDAAFLDPTYPWLEPRLGYARKLHVGPRAREEQIARARASPSSVTAAAFTVTPLVPGRTGGRAFCGDTSGRMCMRADGREPPVKDGRCEPCRKLE